MAKYYIESYEKISQSFLADINTLSSNGNITEPYKIKLKKVNFLGIVTFETKDVSLPKGFNHSRELTKGRLWIQ